MVSVISCPSMGSKLKVCPTRSGGEISLYTPLNGYSLPSGALFMNRHEPPVHMSILSTMVVNSFGPQLLGNIFRVHDCFENKLPWSSNHSGACLRLNLLKRFVSTATAR